MLQVREINAFVKGELAKCEGHLRQMLFVISGSGMVSISDKPIEVCKGRVIFLAGEDSLLAKAGCVVSGFLVVFNDLFFDDFLLHYPRFRECIVFKHRFVDVSNGDIIALVEEMRWLKAENESEVDVMRLKTRFNLVMLVVLDKLILHDANETKNEQLKAGFLQLLESNFRVHRTSGFYAEKLGLTMRKLNELCKVWFNGKGFSSVHRIKLMSAAEYLLLNTDKAIKEIAFDLEFCSQQHFRGYFKRVSGLSPISFRIQQKEIVH